MTNHPFLVRIGHRAAFKFIHGRESFLQRSLHRVVKIFLEQSAAEISRQSDGRKLEIEPVKSLPKLFVTQTHTKCAPLVMLFVRPRQKSLDAELKEVKKESDLITM